MFMSVCTTGPPVSLQNLCLLGPYLGGACGLPCGALTQAAIKLSRKALLPSLPGRVLCGPFGMVWEQNGLLNIFGGSRLRKGNDFLSLLREVHSAPHT